ncbi:MAG TPA: substrate-binding domain-containing protein [Mobilitalea sp.]|nr:substrate-binding domain-containing protein [Mobilitalea sp.]
MLKKSDKPKAEKKNKLISVTTVSSITVGIIIILIGMVYYTHTISELGISDPAQEREYGYHYAIISEEADATFWDAIYQGALEKGKEQNAYVEKIGSNLSITYSLEDLMRIAIASKVDGIILEPNGNEDIAGLIDEADQAGIPVVTVLRDVTGSKRISYVGINSYTLGQTYAKEVLDVVKEGKKNVTVLLNEDTADTSQKEIYTSILGEISGMNITVKSEIINTKSAFSSEEDIRNLIMDNKNSPDLLVCLTAVDTICAYQAVVDYNKVGNIDIVGYYDSDIILRAIEKNIVHSTLTIDANQMGENCVEALTEYREKNNVSDFYSVDNNVINKDNVSNYMKNSADSGEEQ